MAGLIDRLRRARARFRLKLMLAAGLRSLAIAMAVFTIAEVARYLLPGHARSLGLGGQDSYWLAIAGLLISLAAGLALALLRTPALEQVAQLADARFSLLQRITTAYETHFKDPLTPIETALLEDAAARTDEIEPPKLVPISLPRPLWPLVAALGAFLLVQFLPEPGPFGPENITQTTRPANDSAIGDDSVDAATVVQVRRIAELVGRDAEVRRDPYMQAVARSFDDLGRRLETGELTRSELEGEVGRLLQHLDRAMGSDEGSLLADLLASDGASRSSVPGEQETDASGRSNEEFQPEGSGDTAAAEDAAAEIHAEATSATNANENEMPQELEDLLNRLEARFDARQSGSQPEGQSPSRQAQGADEETAGGFYTNVDPELMARLEERQDRLAMQRAKNRAGGQPAGAAQESNEGAGDLAGEGTQPLEGSPQQGMGATEDQFESVELRSDRLADGRRIRIEMEPGTELSDVSGGPEADPADWRRTREGRASGVLLGMMDRDVVSRYFIPPEENRESAPQ